MSFHIQTNAVIVKPEGEPIYCERATIVRIDDEAAGPFVIVEQRGVSGSTRILLEPDEWPMLRKAIDRMIKLCSE